MPMFEARSPFHFNSAAYLLRIERQRASTLGELLHALRACPEDSIFQHTFRTLQEHHFIQEGYSNDFAHWTYHDCREMGLAEQLASVDIRAFTSISDLRGRIAQIVADYLKQNPLSAERQAFKPFYFCASDTVVIPTPFAAHNLKEFLNGLKQVSVHSIHHHFIEARLRLKLQSNDFSLWLEQAMDMGKVAAQLNKIDIYTSTLEGVRLQIAQIVQAAVN
jgi:elongation factor P hydroxylase